MEADRRQAMEWRARDAAGDDGARRGLRCRDGGRIRRRMLFWPSIVLPRGRAESHLRGKSREGFSRRTD